MWAILRVKGIGVIHKLKKGVRYGCEENFDDRWGFCRGL
jgi:hypothetical protein